MGTACVITSGAKSQLSHEAQLSQPRAGTVNRTQLAEEEQPRGGQNDFRRANVNGHKNNACTPRRVFRKYVNKNRRKQASIRRVRVWLGLTDRANSYSCLFMYRGTHSQLRGGQFANSNGCCIHESTVQHSKPAVLS
jgi:hypothetical protein